MKRISLIILMFCASLMSVAQDVIVKRDGTTILSKVEEISSKEIKYRKWSNLEGPLYSIKCSEVTSINYQNGDVDHVTSVTNQRIGRMERDGIDLTLNGRPVFREEVRWLVGEQNYQTYISARSQIRAGRVSAMVFWVSLGATVVSILTGETDVAIVSGVVADVSLPLMIIFKSIGKGRMSWVADEYNKNGKASAFSYQLSPSVMKCNSIESQNHLGLGMTFSLNF